MTCPVCGTGNDPSASRCARCHESLPAPLPVPAYAPAPTVYVPRRPLVTPQRLLLAIGLIGLLGVAALIVVRGGDNTGRAVPPVAAASSATGPSATDAASPATGPSPADAASPAAATSPRDQAAVINALLDQSVASRRRLNDAIQRVRSCTDLSVALADMRTVGEERSRQIAATDAADVSALRDGEALRSTLKAALGFALAADQHFVTWAEPTVTGDCADTPARQAAWVSGQASSTQAQVVKKQLVAAWNPVAAELGFEQRSTQFI